ncbi:MAG: (4Fe-4S)-binding protein [Prevotellaceae bacterium]|jgi:uncharacterized Fe-S cluster protein YjdI|nr:(4Fe-4S)-binding protein [Prevotellaceae bacterium]
MENNIIKHYTNGEITVVWKPGLCIHSGNCWHGLPKVFCPTRRPWCDVTQASTDEIIATVEICPSGALSYFRNTAV